MSYVEEVECTKVAVSHVIGKGGSTIKELKASTNTEISIIDGPKVKVEGEEANVREAVKKIKAILDEQANPDYEGPEGKRLRAEADSYGDQRSEKSKAADAAFAAGNKDEGHALMKEAKELGEKMHATHKLAAAAIVKNRNDGKGEAYLDLHGLRTEEALEVTNERLDTLEQKPEGVDTDLELIPGAGHHSAPGKVALKPACEDLLKKRAIAYEEASAGSFNVHVKGKGNKAAASAETVEAPAASSAKLTAEAHEDKKDAPAAAPPKQEDKPVEPKKEKTKSCCLMM